MLRRRRGTDRSIQVTSLGMALRLSLDRVGGAVATMDATDDDAGVVAANYLEASGTEVNGVQRYPLRSLRFVTAWLPRCIEVMVFIQQRNIRGVVDRAEGTFLPGSCRNATPTATFKRLSGEGGAPCERKREKGGSQGEEVVTVVVCSLSKDLTTDVMAFKALRIGFIAPPPNIVAASCVILDVQESRKDVMKSFGAWLADLSSTMDCSDKVPTLKYARSPFRKVQEVAVPHKVFLSDSFSLCNVSSPPRLVESDKSPSPEFERETHDLDATAQPVVSHFTHENSINIVSEIADVGISPR
ncbi:hypothetical protein BKA70DRAFT_1220401 [Coprinopsis sp. MPI-PUGE-AT-0042]|nr:hypothetical protein BKA70DRAFT_1220401 [Coprinopsis sp. MPI-PUGE-AT-0042]